MPERSRAGKQVVRKAAKELSISLDPAVKKYTIQLVAPTLHDMTTGDYERVLTALKDDYGLEGLTFDYRVLLELQDALRAGDWMATLTVWMDKEIIKAEPGSVEVCYGLAVDVGTTTCVGYLCDLSTGKVINTESMMNPQVPYGEDVMSRITYAMTNQAQQIPDLLLATEGTVRMATAVMIGNVVMQPVTGAAQHFNVRRRQAHFLA